jgi:heme/copper-type cytochrome/quinol oxidase subunit 3
VDIEAGKAVCALNTNCFASIRDLILLFSSCAWAVTKQKAKARKISGLRKIFIVVFMIAI